jgi:hypothetical protein
VPFVPPGPQPVPERPASNKARREKRTVRGIIVTT